MAGSVVFTRVRSNYIDAYGKCRTTSIIAFKPRNDWCSSEYFSTAYRQMLRAEIVSRQRVTLNLIPCLQEEPCSKNFIQYSATVCAQNKDVEFVVVFWQLSATRYSYH